jgi:small subunit ribosomal protein S21
VGDRLGRKIVPNWENRGLKLGSGQTLPDFETISMDSASAIHHLFTVSRIIRDAIWRVWRWDFLAEVRVQEGEPLENALRRFKRKVQQEDIIKEVKRHSYYLKPGEKKRVKAALARKRNRKKARKEQD